MPIFVFTEKTRNPWFTNHRNHKKEESWKAKESYLRLFSSTEANKNRILIRTLNSEKTWLTNRPETRKRISNSSSPREIETEEGGRRRVRPEETNHGGVGGEAVARPTEHGRRSSKKSQERHRRPSLLVSHLLLKGRNKTLGRPLLSCSGSSRNGGHSLRRPFFTVRLLWVEMINLPLRFQPCTPNPDPCDNEVPQCRPRSHFQLRSSFLEPMMTDRRECMHNESGGRSTITKIVNPNYIYIYI